MNPHSQTASPPTPRTDSVYENHGGREVKRESAYYDLIDHARRLERELIEQTAIARRETLAAQHYSKQSGPDEPADGKKLWLWQNFVDGRPEYWAFTNPYPTFGGGDPITLGSPCGWAIFKESTVSQNHRAWTAAEVENEIKRAKANPRSEPKPEAGDSTARDAALEEVAVMFDQEVANTWSAGISEADAAYYARRIREMKRA